MHMKDIFILLNVAILCFYLQNQAFSQALIGEISQEEFKITRPQVIDANTREPIRDALISIPAENKRDFTDENGHFKITSSKTSPVILSVQKEGYRPFSLTLHDGKLPQNLLLELSKNNPMSVVVNDNLLHLGDNSYSEHSSGACMINAPCVGSSFTKDFYIQEITPKTKAWVTIGSVIGIDTIQAMKLGQNKLKTASSSPMEIFVNKTKIGELKINGDNQKIPIPTKILKPKSNNTLTVKTGVNLAESSFTDYDEVELMNLIVDIAQ